MILSMWEIVALIGVVGLCMVLSGLCGAYVMFKGSRAVPGEKFLGGIPKGEVFSIPDLAEEEAEKGIVKERLNQFLKSFEGGEK